MPRGGGFLTTVLPEMNVMLLLGSCAGSHLDVLSHLFLAATIQMIMTLELWPLFIFPFLLDRRAWSEPKVEAVEDAGGMEGPEF